MTNSRRLLYALFIFGLFCFASQARADVLVITSGYLNVPPASGPSYAFAGQGLAVSNSLGGSDFGHVAARSCQPCAAGSTVSLNSGWAGEFGLGHGAATVNGVYYPNMYYTGAISFAGTLVLPPLNISSDTFTIEAPFTFSGNMNGYLSNPAIGPPGPAIFSTMLSGQGIATLQFFTYVNADGVRMFVFNSITYNFQPEAIPEPTTLLLLGTGLAGIAAFARRRRARRNQPPFD